MTLGSLGSLGTDLLAVIAGLLPLADRKSLSHASAGLHAASRLTTWWPPELRVHIPDPVGLGSFDAWLRARSLGTRILCLRVDSEQLVEGWQQFTPIRELPRCATYDDGAGFESMMQAVVDHMPRLDELNIIGSDGTLFLPVG